MNLESLMTDINRENKCNVISPDEVSEANCGGKDVTVGDRKTRDLARNKQFVFSPTDGSMEPGKGSLTR